MANILVIKWHGMRRSNVMMAAETLANILVAEGKYIQAFPEFHVYRDGIPPTVVFRVSSSPIRLHSLPTTVDVEILLEPALLNYLDRVKVSQGNGALLLVNSALTPQAITEKFNLEEKILTLHVDSILQPPLPQLPHIPLAALLVKSLNLLPMEIFYNRLQEFMAKQRGMDKKVNEAILKAIDLVLREDEA